MNALMSNDKSVYAFALTKNNLSVWTLYRLKNVDCCYQVFGEASIDKYMEFLLNDNPPYILGLGVYTGRDQDKIRIEQKCTNKFRNDFMDGDRFVEFDITTFLKPAKLSKYAVGIGNSYCNMASWKIVNLVNKGELSSKYTFIHISKRMKTHIVVEEVDSMLKSFKSET